MQKKVIVCSRLIDITTILALESDRGLNQSFFFEVAYVE